MQCNHESYKFENMMDLTVEIHGNVDTIEDALARFTASEWLDGDNKYRCERWIFPSFHLFSILVLGLETAKVFLKIEMS
jgi:hypothetical protein